MSKKWTDADDKIVVDMLRRGLTYSQVASHFGVTRHSIAARAYKIRHKIALHTQSKKKLSINFSKLRVVY